MVVHWDPAVPSKKSSDSESQSSALYSTGELFFDLDTGVILLGLTGEVSNNDGIRVFALNRKYTL